jgi:molybdenum cofactor biosynthesis enzyme MoaA
MTADGKLKVCLFGNTEINLRDPLRDSNSDPEQIKGGEISEGFFQCVTILKKMNKTTVPEWWSFEDKCQKGVDFCSKIS